MDIVTIKLYLDDTICSDYHDIMIDKYQQKIDELHKYGKHSNKQILFFVCEDNTFGDNFAEITTNANLTT